MEGIYAVHSRSRVNKDHPPAPKEGFLLIKAESILNKSSPNLFSALSMCNLVKYLL
jgi:hypothetical protein